MKPKNMPYPNRDPVPLYFYPFLSTISNKASLENLHAYASDMDQRKNCKPEVLLYIHIPYCKSICHFCGFYRDVTKENDNILARYVEALKNEIKRYTSKTYIQETIIDTVYIGGGTPSILPPKKIEDLLKCIRANFTLSDDAEFSFEGEVRTLKDMDRLSVLKDYGCTRVSFGVQSFDQKVRRLSGLVPTVSDIFECINNISKFDYNINLDLMYGLPGQSQNVWYDDLNKAVGLNAANIDIYDTVLYPHTMLFKKRLQLKDELPTEAQRLQMFKKAVNLLSEANYYQETIEDFSKPGKAYKMKRLVYGGGDGRSEIIALGASAVGMVKKSAYRNHPPEEYLKLAQDNSFPLQLYFPMQDIDFYKRALVFFPKNLKLNLKDVQSDWLERYRTTIDDMIARNLITETNTELTLTDNGLAWSDNIAMEFVNDPQEVQKIWKIGY